MLAFAVSIVLYPDGLSALAHQVDHILSRKHEGDSHPENLAFSCIFCIRYKGTDVAAIDARTREPIRLFNPRLDRWPDHFSLDGALIKPLTAIGEVTARLLRFNDSTRVSERSILQDNGHYPRGRP